MWGGVKESMLTLQVAERLEAELQKRGLKTAMTRRSDVFLALCERPEIANRYPRSIFVSIHFNSHRSAIHRGVETYYGRLESLPLARAIQSRMVERLRAENRGVKQRLDFRVLRVTRGPAVLLECGFISNPIERRLARTEVYQNALVQSIADGIMAEHQQPPGIFLRTYHTLLGWARDRVDELQGDIRPWL
jgi:N-acetylmuramoyl-L-alanine amidase